MLYTCTKSFIIWTVVALCSVNSVKTYHNISIENELRENLFRKYDKVVIPNSRDGIFVVNMRMVLKSAELDYETSQMKLSTWFIANWNDERLSWNPDEYGQLNSIIVSHREVWHPDIMAYNNVDANMEDDRTRVNSVVNSTGSVIWVEPVQYSIHCDTDTTYWPHDTQTGFLRLGSWMYLGNVLNLTTDSDEVEESTSSHSEWDIIEVTKKRNVRYYPCCPDEQYIDIDYNVTVKRKVHPYQSVIYIPALCSASFHLITFWLPNSDNYYKLFANLFNATFIALTILATYSKIPIITSSIPLIIVYYTYSLGLISVTTVISMAVKRMSSVSKPLPHGATQFLHSSYLAYLGIEIHDPTAECHMLCESQETNTRTADLNDRQKFAEVIDRLCFVAFAFVHLILLLRFVL